MSGVGSRRSKSSFGLDESVKRALRLFAEEKDPTLARLALRREFAKLSTENRATLIARMAEISLGQLHALLLTLR